MTPVGLAATAATAAATAGLAAVAATTLGVRMLQAPGPLPAEPGVTTAGFLFYVLVFGTLAGIVLAGLIAWTLLAPIGSTYRRGGLALVSAFATIMLMLICMPVDQLLGKPGLASLSALCATTALLLARRARRATVSAPT